LGVAYACTIAVAWGGFAARKTHLAKSDSQPQLKAILEKGRKNAIGPVRPTGSFLPFYTLVQQLVEPGDFSKSKMCFCVHKNSPGTSAAGG
jgi:hypothetical protein